MIDASPTVLPSVNAGSRGWAGQTLDLCRGTLALAGMSGWLAGFAAAFLFNWLHTHELGLVVEWIGPLVVGKWMAASTALFILIRLSLKAPIELDDNSHLGLLRSFTSQILSVSWACALVWCAALLSLLIGLWLAVLVQDLSASGKLYDMASALLTWDELTRSLMRVIGFGVCMNLLAELERRIDHPLQDGPTTRVMHLIATGLMLLAAIEGLDAMLFWRNGIYA